MRFFKMVAADFRAVFERDPAARNGLEVVLAYPGFHAVLLHRVAHALWNWRVPIIPRLISHLNRFLTGIEIHPGARIGQGFFIDHGMGVVIGETAEIGDGVTLYQEVTLGGTGREPGKRHPTVGDDVMVAAGAKVLGAVHLGAGSKVGAGSVVLESVPDEATVVGVPGRLVKRRDPTPPGERVENLPDPDAEALQALKEAITRLEERLEVIAGAIGAARIDMRPAPWPEEAGARQGTGANSLRAARGEEDHEHAG